MSWIKKISSVCAYVCDCSHDDRFNGLVAVINAYIIKHSKFPFYDSSISKLFSDPNCQDMIRSWNQKHTWSYSNIVNTLDNTTDFGIHLCTLKVICHSLLHINLKRQFSKSDGDYLNSSSIMDALRNCSIMGHSAIIYGFVPGDGKHPHYSATFSRYLVVSMNRYLHVENDTFSWIDIRDAKHIADVICAVDETKVLLNYLIYFMDFRATEASYKRFRTKRDNLIRNYVRDVENDSSHKRKFDDR
jgi:hypothetical protein